ncbi:ABC transporter ATP-binding protein [Clostridium sp. PL3]|uniref:ABC transporter ATP-binding protein n=1 Tax=Clostridium thailandense TaxID=2794346 RepID=A0A949U546_9CLOT|nr:ABC transporter ATP-binding protein [Clostridium thailandense]MBV7276614.1 ABC transporter ATP-binding protein [Clostridium thailandense]
MSKLLEIEHVRVSYEKKNIIADVNFSVEAGEFCALLGLNGSGKTTLLRAVCGLLKTDQGRITVAGRCLGPMNEYKRARLLSYIPQRSSEMNGATVLDVVLMGLNPHIKLLQAPSHKQKEQAVRLLQQAGLSGYENHDFDKISEGQKQLAIFTRALLQDAPVMLMDEPDSALDFVNRNIVLSRIKNAVHEKKKAGLITLHDPNFALAFCDRLLLLKSGNIACDIELKAASNEEIRQGLSLIYGRIDLLEHKGKRLMVAF